MKYLVSIATAAVLALTPFATTAQQSERTVETTTVPVEHHDFPWGLLGLIGLAGLIPRKQNVVHVDRTTTTRP